MSRYPIVLAHGIARPDHLVHAVVKRVRRYLPRLSWDRLHYFRGIAGHLRKHGFEVYHSNVSFAAGIERRAKDLRQEVQRILDSAGSGRVHIIGHSMGGLDARSMIVRENMADRVATLTTIGTPHLGTSFADWGLRHGGKGFIDVLRQIIRLDGFRDLTREECARFNEAAMDAEAKNDVVYQTYASSQIRERTFLPFQASWEIIAEREGDNDGLVSASSQRWQERLVARDGTVKQVRQRDFSIAADHFNQVGWWHPNQVSGRSAGRSFGPFRGRRRFERTVKGIYLQIAEEVQRLI